MFKNQECHKTLYNHSNITTKKSFFQEVRPKLAHPMPTFASSKHLKLII